MIANKQEKPWRRCADCIHENACRVWTGGRLISDTSATRCPSYETVKESAAYLCGVLDERQRKKTIADHIRAMSDMELATWICNGISSDACDYCDYNNGYCDGSPCSEKTDADTITEWLQQPWEVDE